MEMLIGGRWRPGAGVEEVTSPFDGAMVGTVPVATVEDVDAALAAAQAGAERWRRTPAHERMRVLLRAAGRERNGALRGANAAGGHRWVVR